MLQQDGTSADAMLSRSGSQYQLHRPSHSSSGLSRQQSALRRTNASMRCASAPSGSTQPVAAHPRHEQVGETGLLHHQAAAVNHASSGSSSCETATYAVVYCFHVICCTLLHDWLTYCKWAEICCSPILFFPIYTAHICVRHQHETYTQLPSFQGLYSCSADMCVMQPTRHKTGCLLQPQGSTNSALSPLQGLHPSHMQPQSGCSPPTTSTSSWIPCRAWTATQAGSWHQACKLPSTQADALCSSWLPISPHTPPSNRYAPRRPLICNSVLFLRDADSHPGLQNASMMTAYMPCFWLWCQCGQLQVAQMRAAKSLHNKGWCVAVSHPLQL